MGMFAKCNFYSVDTAEAVENLLCTSVLLLYVVVLLTLGFIPIPVTTHLVSMLHSFSASHVGANARNFEPLQIWYLGQREYAHDWMGGVN